MVMSAAGDTRRVIQQPEFSLWFPVGGSSHGRLESYHGADGVERADDVSDHGVYHGEKKRGR